MFRKVKLANRSSGSCLWELIQVPFEHPTWTVQELTQEAHSVSVVPAVSKGSVLAGKRWRGDQVGWGPGTGITSPARPECSGAGGPGREALNLLFQGHFLPVRGVAARLFTTPSSYPSISLGLSLMNCTLRYRLGVWSDASQKRRHKKGWLGDVDWVSFTPQIIIQQAIS